MNHQNKKNLTNNRILRSANEFLSQLAAENNGRYHRSSKSDREIHLFVHKILTEGVQDNYVRRFTSIFESFFQLERDMLHLYTFLSTKVVSNT